MPHTNTPNAARLLRGRLWRSLTHLFRWKTTWGTARTTSTNARATELLGAHDNYPLQTVVANCVTGWLTDWARFGEPQSLDNGRNCEICRLANTNKATNTEQRARECAWPQSTWWQQQRPTTHGVDGGSMVLVVYSMSCIPGCCVLFAACASDVAAAAFLRKMSRRWFWWRSFVRFCSHGVIRDVGQMGGMYSSKRSVSSLCVCMCCWGLKTREALSLHVAAKTQWHPQTKNV